MGLSCSPSPSPSPIKGEGEGGWCCLCSPYDPSVRHWDRLFDSSLIKGEGDLVGCFVLLSARPCPSGLRVKSAMTVLMVEMMWRTVFPALWIPAYAGMTVRDAAMTWRCSPPCGYCLKASMSLRHGRSQ